jgi:hypothetical protein
VTVTHPDPDELKAARDSYSPDLEMKLLTAENWVQADYVNLIFVRVDLSTGAVRPMSGADYMEAVLEPKLDPNVPLEIRRLFEIGRGMMAYGYFFYPLYAASVDHLYRVAEAAVRLRVSQKGGATRRNFEKLIDWLADNGVLTADEVGRWHVLRKLRNQGTHRDRPTQFPAGTAVTLAHAVAEDVNALFGVPRPARRRR